MNELEMSRTGNRITPEEGIVYTDHFGSRYLCIEAPNSLGTDDAATMQRVSDGWTVRAHNIYQFPDGHIEWGFSTDGHWAI